MTSDDFQHSPLPQIHQYVTGHNNAGQAVIRSEGEPQWTRHRALDAHYAVPFTTSHFPVDLNDDQDVRAHEQLLAVGTLGLVQPGGTVCRIVDFGTSREKPLAMHRTRSLDFGVVLEGALELLLDSGEVRTLRRGDVAVQRGTMHAWRNPSATEHARMLFVLQDCVPVRISEGGRQLEEETATLGVAARI